MWLQIRGRWVYQQYQHQKTLFLTSRYVLCELFTRLVYDFGKGATQKAINEISVSIENKGLSLLEIDEVIFKKSQDALIKFSEHKLSFTDAASYVLYKDFSIDEVFTLDSDFKKIRVNTSF